MNLLHPHPHHHIYFHIPRYYVLIQNNKIGRGFLRTLRCKSWEPESESRGGRGVTGSVAGRDRIISFGKHKGKMLGTLPSSYLKWVSSNLRAGDYEEWAKLADQVLQDPIYRDRIEWEMALNVLNGNNLKLNLRTTSSSSSSSSAPAPNAVSLLLDISHRFGWDNEDKVGWSKVDFDLLGTSRGGRIPRLVVNHNHNHNHNQTQHEHQASTCLSTSTGLNDDELRRLQRRERQRKMRSRRTQAQAQALQHKEDNNVNMDDGGDVARQNQNQNQIEKESAVANNPLFPGRQALLQNYRRAHTRKHNRSTNRI